MSDITLSSAVRSNLLSLQNTADLLAKTQERLSTGLKVNSALDNPTNFFTASSLNSRAGDLGRLLDGVANATQTLEAADNGIAAITDLVESAQASARQALQARGQQTTSVVTGADSATFNPQSLTTVAGDNTVTGTNAGGITADASAVLASGVVAADADITVASGDLSGAGNSATALDDVGGSSTMAIPSRSTSMARPTPSTSPTTTTPVAMTPALLSATHCPSIPMRQLLKQRQPSTRCLVLTSPSVNPTVR
jgi:flagellin